MANVRRKLQNDPALDCARIRVSVDDDRSVKLEGVVHTYGEKCRAEEIVHGLRGVSAVHNELEVRLTIGDYRPDATLERVLGDVIDCLARMPSVRPRATVTNGWVTLHGTVPRGFQRQLVENAVREVAGVVGISNLIEIEA